jgi:hypothetical protein
MGVQCAAFLEVFSMYLMAVMAPTVLVVGSTFACVVQDKLV